MANLAGGSWMVINDDVMGGRSTAEALTTEEGLLFRGTLSLENNGGFSSTRRVLDQRPAGRSGVRVQVRGDGREYQLRLRPDRNFDGVAWRAPFETTGDWQEMEVRFEAFEPVFRGRPVRSAGAIDPARVSQLGFMIADKRSGDFSLEVRRIEFF